MVSYFRIAYCRDILVGGPRKNTQYLKIKSDLRDDIRFVEASLSDTVNMGFL
jgi:hypothetical protein